MEKIVQSVDALRNELEEIEVLSKAMDLRTEFLGRLEEGDFPNKEYIQLCKEIIELIPETDNPTDKTERFPKTIKKRLIKRFSGCVACGEGIVGGSRHDPVIEVHHIIPRQAGGGISIQNAALFCRFCHLDIHS